MKPQEDGPIARILFGAASIAFVAYYVYSRNIPHFGPITGAIIYLGVFAGIVQLFELPFGYFKRRREPK